MEEKTEVQTIANNGEGEFEVTIIGAEEGTGDYQGRVNLICDEGVSLVYINKQGVEDKTDTFSLNNFALIQQLRKVCKPFNLQLMIANGHLEAGDIGLFLYNTKMTIRRTFVKANTPRRYGTGVYEHDTYVTDIVQAEKTKDVEALTMLAANIRERKALTHMAVANPFGF